MFPRFCATKTITSKEITNVVMRKLKTSREEAISQNGGDYDDGK